MPSDGTVVVTAYESLIIDHTNPIEDKWTLSIATDNATCLDAPWAHSESIPATPPAEVYNKSAYHQMAYAVAAGTYTFYVNGYMNAGADPGDSFVYGAVIAVFYPS